METPPQGRLPPSCDADRLREELIILCVDCPHFMMNPSACPLHEVRKLEPAAVIDWIDGLSREEQEFLLRYHECCLSVEWEREWARRFLGLETDPVQVATATQEDRERGAVSAGLP